MEMSGRSCFLAKRSRSGRRAISDLSSRDDLAEHARRRQPRGAAQVDGGLGVAGPLEHAARPVAQREDVPGPVEVVRPRVRVDQRGDGGGPVGRRDAGRRAVPVVDTDGEGGPLGLGVGRHHERQVELVGALGQHRHADHAGRVGQEERDLLGRRRLGRHDQVALVLPILVVDDHHHAEATDGVDGFFDGRESHQAATSTRRSSPMRSTDTNFPLHTSAIVPAPGPAKSGRASSPPKKTGAR